jgi:spermidine synthase
MKKPYHLFILLGFTSLVAQVLLMRELVVVFQGTELSLGLVLGNWLFWVGMGSISAGIVLPRMRIFSRVSAIAVAQVLLGLLPLATVLGARGLPSLLPWDTAGELVGYGPILASSFLLLAPLCILMGFMFALFCHQWRGPEKAWSIRSVYIFEGIGAAGGGVVFAGIFAHFLSPIQSACMLLIFNFAAAASILARNQRSVIVSSAIALLALIGAGASFSGIAGKLEIASTNWLWRGLPVADSKYSIYGNVAFIEDDEQKSLYENGLLMFSYPDKFSAEEAVHFALLEHPSPEKVLLIGGGAGGALGEVLKHPVAHVDYVELDPLIIEMVRRHFPAEVQDALDDPRVAVHNMDGRLFLKDTSRSYDAIIINLPDPSTAQLNRFYTTEFFGICKRKMNSGGIISFRLTSAENYFSPELRQFLGCIYNSLKEVFPDIEVVPGGMNVFLASVSPQSLTLEPSPLIRRLSLRGMRDKVAYVREYYLPFRLAKERVEAIQAVLSSKTRRTNTDFTPVCYYYNSVLRSKQFKDFFAPLLSRLSRIAPAVFLAIIVILFVATALGQALFPNRWGAKSLLVSVGTTGFAEITLEVVALLAFQALRGYVYQKMAIIIACFMIGLSLGAAMTGRIGGSGASKKRQFLLVQTMVCIYPLLLLAVLLLVKEFDKYGVFSAGDITFSVLTFAAGLIGGLQFPLANALWLEWRPEVARAAGYTYGVDLIGSCIGAVFTTAIFIPLLGIPFTCIIASAVNLGSLMLLVFHFQKTPAVI